MERDGQRAMAGKQETNIITAYAKRMFIKIQQKKQIKTESMLEGRNSDDIGEREKEDGHYLAHNSAFTGRII